MFKKLSSSVYLFCGVGGVGTGLLLSGIQMATLRFGFLDTVTCLKLIGIYGLVSSFLFLIILLLNSTKNKRAVILCLSTVVIMISLTQFNCNNLPNVLLIVSDATRADHLSLYGYNRQTTPFLERFAKEAIVFNQAMAQGTHTIVSTPSLLASVYPSTHKVVNYRKVLNSEFVLIPEMLKAAGYTTFGCAANPHLGSQNGFSQGYDKYVFIRSWADVDAPQVFRSLLDWLTEVRERPFFGFLFCIDPHTPYNPPPPYNRLFDPDWQGKMVTEGIHGKPIPERELQNMIAQYDGEIALVDKALEKLIGKLKAQGLFDNTVIIYTSDHGEDLYDREDDYGHGKAPYEEVARIPLVIRLPSPIKFPLVKLIGRKDEIVSHVDILPSIAEFLHLKRPKTAMGISFMDLIRNERPKMEKFAFLEEILNQYGPYHIQAIRTERYKLIKFLKYEKEKNRNDELYDLESDPKEQKNLFLAKPAIAKKLQQKMLAIEAIATSRFKGPAKETQLDQETIDRLHALGYL